MATAARRRAHAAVHRSHRLRHTASVGTGSRASVDHRRCTTRVNQCRCHSENRPTVVITGAPVDCAQFQFAGRANAHEQTDLDDLRTVPAARSGIARLLPVSFGVTENLQNPQHAGYRLPAGFRLCRRWRHSARTESETRPARRSITRPGRCRCFADRLCAGARDGHRAPLAAIAAALNSAIHAALRRAWRRVVTLHIVNPAARNCASTPLHAGHELAHGMSHLRGGLDDDAVVGVVAHAGHEGSVDLERMHRQIAQVTGENIRCRSHRWK